MIFNKLLSIQLSNYHIFIKNILQIISFFTLYKVI